jgi:glycine dehydrogenase
MAGMQVVIVACDERGNIDVEDLRKKATEHKDNLSCPDGHLSLDAWRF